MSFNKLKSRVISASVVFILLALIVFAFYKIGRFVVGLINYGRR